MKLITYVKMGKVGFGVIKNGGIIELNDRIGNDVTSIKSLLKKNEQKKAQEIYEEMTPDISLSEITYLPVIPDPEKIFCIGSIKRKQEGQMLITQLFSLVLLILKLVTCSHCSNQNFQRDLISKVN